jgi:multiple antibiotic resistance protein
MPLLAGPGSIATVMVLMSKGKGLLSALAVVISIVFTFVASYFVLRAAALVQRVLKTSGVAILERLMGLILAAIAVQFIADGGRDLLR